MKEAADKNALFSLSVTPMSFPLHLDLFKLRPPRVGEEDIMNFTLLFNLSSLYWPYPYHPTRWWVPTERRMMINPRSSNSHTLGQTSSVGPLARTDDQDTSASWECCRSPILMPPRVTKIVKQEKHVSTMQCMPKDVWEDLNFMVGLSSPLYLKVMRCVWGLEKWYHILKSTKLYSNHFIKIQSNFFNRWANDAEERMGRQKRN